MDPQEDGMNTPRFNVEELSYIIVNEAFRIHKELGPGLLEKVYESVLSRGLEKRGLHVEQQKAVSFDYDGMHFDEELRVDMLVEDLIVVELKSVEILAPVHSKQVLTYMRLLNLTLGLLINFGAPTFKDGCKRIVNNHQTFASSREPNFWTIMIRHPSNLFIRAYPITRNTPARVRGCPAECAGYPGGCRGSQFRPSTTCQRRPEPQHA